MKKILFFIFVMCSIGCFAQDSTKTNDHIIYLDVPKKLNIKDKIILHNSSAYTILQVAVVIAGDRSTLGTGSMIYPDEFKTLASFSDNALKKLRGVKIALKVKACKKMIGDTSSTGVAGGSVMGGSFGMGIKHKDIKAEDLNNLKPEDITYDFKANLYEANHDLYINVCPDSPQGSLDF